MNEYFEKNNVLFDASEYYNNFRDISVLVGQTISDVIQSNDEIIFTTTNGYRYKMYHGQDCCESVSIESIVGDLNDLIGQEILLAECRCSNEKQDWEEVIKDDYWEDSFTWTFYTIRCLKASIDIRWYGSSNGYYSESVDFIRIQ